MHCLEIKCPPLLLSLFIEYLHNEFVVTGCWLNMISSRLKLLLFIDAGLSHLEYPGLKAIDPAYALPVDVVNRIFIGSKSKKEF